MTQHELSRKVSKRNGQFGAVSRQVGPYSGCPVSGKAYGDRSHIGSRTFCWGPTGGEDLYGR